MSAYHFSGKERRRFCGVLSQVRNAGYDAFEGRAIFGKAEAQRIKTVVDAHDLKCAAFHANIKILADEDLKETASACEETSFEWLVVEQDRPVVDAYAEVKESRNFLKTIGY